jgi:hypothetical protein
MIPSSNSKRGDRRARQNKLSGNVTVRTPSEAFELRLSVFKDKARLLGKHFLSLTAINTMTNINLTANLFGSRSAAYANIFARWRIVRILLQPIVGGSGGTTPVAIGFLDDSSLTSDAPTTLDDVVQLRCSTLLSTGSSVDTSFEFRPVDPKMWYYTETESSTSDARLYIPTSLWYISTGTSTTVNYLMSYELQFEGAVSNV